MTNSHLLYNFSFPKRQKQNKKNNKKKKTNLGEKSEILFSSLKFFILYFLWFTIASSFIFQNSIFKFALPHRVALSSKLLLLFACCALSFSSSFSLFSGICDGMFLSQSG